MRGGLERALCGGWRPAGRVGTARTSGGLSTARPGVGGPPSSFLPPSQALRSAMGPSGQIWVAELKPVISFAPASSVPSGELFVHFPLLAPAKVCGGRAGRF